MTTVSSHEPREGRTQTSPPGSGRSPYRNDIQGLRALAVLSVVLNHAGVGFFSGGYVGVDVFFVISGFLITQLLLTEAQRTGRISLRTFYSRRARRILPAATVVLLVTIFASERLLGYVEASKVVKDSIWATFFAANIHLARDGSDYFAADAPPSPVQHYWSLAVEEQFYLVWPLVVLLLIAGVAVVRGRQAAGGRHAASGGPINYPLPIGRILVALLAICAASFAWSVVITSRNPSVGYFSTMARGWELALGAICAVIVPVMTALPAQVRAAMGWVGLGAIVFAVVDYTSLTAFPGTAAALPVLGTGLVVLGGVGGARLGPRLLLDRRPCQLVGSWSYSFYLWHWPFLVIVGEYLRRPLSVPESLGLLVLALALSAFSYRYVERPFRQARAFAWPAGRGLLLYPTSAVGILIAANIANGAINGEIAAASTAPPIVVPHQPAISTTTDQGAADQATIDLVQASVRAAKAGAAVPGDLDPAVTDLSSDTVDVHACDYFHPVRILCREGDDGGSKTMVVYGDSHARALIPALEPIAEREGYAAYYLVKPGCNATTTPPATGNGVFKDCLDWRAWAAEQIADLQPDILIVSSDTPAMMIAPNGQVVTNDDEILRAYQGGLQQSLARLEPDVGHLVIIGDPPGVDQGPAVCLSSRGVDLGDCMSRPSRQWRDRITAQRAVAEAGGYQFVNPRRWFCAGGQCPSVIGSMIPYRDTNHITTAYAAWISRPMEAALNLPAGW